jgi:hypothetical protein
MLVVATNDGIRGISFQVSSGASSAGSASVVELALVAAGLIGILLFLTMGGSQAVGRAMGWLPDRKPDEPASVGMEDWPEWGGDDLAADDEAPVGDGPRGTEDGAAALEIERLQRLRSTPIPSDADFPPYDGLSEQEIFNYDDSTLWPIAACGHRHPPAIDLAAIQTPVVAGGIYRAAASVSVSTAWEPGRRPDPIELEPGSLVRCNAWVGTADSCSDIYWDGYRCQIISGLHAGRCFEIADAGTPTDPGLEWRGLRPSLGLPSILILVTPRAGR